MPHKNGDELKPTTEQLEKRVQELEAAIQKSETKNHELHRYMQVFLMMQHEVHIWQLVYNDDHTIKTWRLIDANRAALKSWNKKHDEVIGRLTDDIFQTNATELFLPIVQKIFKEHKPYSWEKYFDSTGQYLEMTSIPLHDSFISIGVDISAFKKSEALHKDTILKLQEAISAGNIGLWDWDLETNETFFSPEWKAQLGYLDHEIKNTFEEWRRRVHRDDIDRVLKEIELTLTTKRPVYEVEFRMQHKDSSYRWIMAHASLLLDDTGEPVRMVGSHIDITKQKRMEETVLQHQKMQALGTLAGGIAHDFNNILTPLLGYTQMLKGAFEVTAKESRYVEQIELAATRAKDLVQQILLVSRTPTNPVAQVEPVYLNKILDEVATLLKTTTHQNIKVTLKHDNDVPAIGANASQMHRIILNLCNNAIQAMPNGGELTIELFQTRTVLSDIDASTQSECICLSIKDTGVGMSEDMQKRIFEPFFTTKDKGEERGTGLGLAIVSTIVKQHGGKIDVASELGKGSSFTLYFPIIPIGFNATVNQIASEKSDTIQSILLVDDESALCELGTIILSELGYKVSAFQQAEKALEHLLSNSGQYQLIITDYGMPEMSGVELINKVKEHNIHIPILVVTGFTNMVNDAQKVIWGCDGIISKPYKLNELKRAIFTIGESLKM
ncbi:MAG TPA: ATP-binding protein [Rheinheimera sp.]|nr:ATP-binding protein [Rheinheimera sp.]